MLMQKNKMLGRIHPYVRLLSLILLVLSLFIAKSIYLILLITTFMMIVYTFFGKSVLYYVKFFKTRFIFLLILIIFYILIIDKYVVIDLILFSYKLILTSFIIYNYELSVDFDELHESIYGIIHFIKRKNACKFSYNIAMSLYIVKKWFDSKEILRNTKKFTGEDYSGFSCLLSSRAIMVIRMAKNKQLNLSLNYYRLKYKKIDLKSKICLVMFIIFFVICLFKEVIC